MSGLTDDEKFLFDLKGYLVFPAVLQGEDLAMLRRHAESLHRAPGSLPPAEQQLPGGPAELLVDHPAVMRVLNTVIERRTERIRLEDAFLSWRERGDGHVGWSPHAGGTTVVPNYGYRFHNGQIYSGMTRVVWELTDVEKGKGGTSFMPGSHKANFKPFPRRFDDRDSGIWETYGCPAGSLVVFSEAVRHSACAWEQDSPRCALFFAYNHVNVRHHKPAWSDVVLAGLPDRLSSFFHEVYHPQFDERTG